MGRTVPAYSQQIQLVEERLKDYRRALRKEDRLLLDELLLMARKQVQAGVMASNPNPFDSMALAMLIDLQKQIKRLERRLVLLERSGPQTESLA